MGSNSSRSVEIQISNNTKNITLKNPRTYFGHGYCSKGPLPELSPGSSDTCSLQGNPAFLGLMGTTTVSGILVYEAESFTLAIYFSNPYHRQYFFMRLGLELSPGKAHLGDLRATYSRMAGGTYSSSDQDIKFTRVTTDERHRSTQLRHGPVKVTATMVSQTSSTLKVVMEQQRVSEEEAWGKNPLDVQGDESMSSEDEYGHLFLRTAPKPLDGLQAPPLLRRLL